LSSDTQAVQGAAPSQPSIGGDGVGGSQSNVLPIDSSVELLDFSKVVENIIGEIKAVGVRIANLESFVESYRGNDLPSIKQNIEEIRKGLQAVWEDLTNVRRETSISKVGGGLWGFGSILYVPIIGRVFVWRGGLTMMVSSDPYMEINLLSS